MLEREDQSLLLEQMIEGQLDARIVKVPSGGGFGGNMGA